MINASCKTAIQSYQDERWPTEFAALPRINDLVRSNAGVELRVDRVIHTTKLVEGHSDRGYSSKEIPIIVIELVQDMAR